MSQSQPMHRARRFCLNMASQSTGHSMMEALEIRQFLSGVNVTPPAAPPLATPGDQFTGDVKYPSSSIQNAPPGQVGRAYTQYQILLNRQKGGVFTPLAGTGSPGGVTPAQMQKAYGVNNVVFGNIAGDGTGQTIAIVDAYDDPNMVSSTAGNFNISDLHRFDVQFGLPDPPSFTKVNQSGGTSYPTYNSGWAGEIALDVEWAHSIAPKANIVLVEATDNSNSNLYAAVAYARSLPGVSTITMSWGGSETSSDTSSNTTYFTTPAGHSGISFFSSAGDAGTPASYPAYSPNVVAIGGTALYFSDSSGTWSTENVWNNSQYGTNNTNQSPGATGGGISTVEAKPSYQNLVTTPSSSNRTAPDVAMDADPYNGGVSVLDASSTGIGSANGWWVYGGTSLSSPMWAGLGAIIDQGRALEGLGNLDSGTQLLPKLYSLSANDFHDVTSGNNRLTRRGTYWSASVGYDAVTGRGTPKADLLIPHVAGIVLSGTVYSDTNSNGQLDSGESGMGNVTVYLDANNNGVFDGGDTKATTDSSGNYSFGEKPGGQTYVVREILPNGYNATSPTFVSSAPAWGVTADNFGLALPLTTSFSGNAFTVRLDASATQVQIFTSATATGSPSNSIALGLLSSTPLTFTGTGSGDVFNVDLSNGNPVPGGGITFAGSGNNSTFHVAGATDSANTISVSNSAVTVFGSSPIAYSNVANVTLDTGAGDDVVNYNGPTTAAFAFHGGSGNDTLNVNSGSLVFDHDVITDTAALTLNVQTGAGVQFNSIQHLAGLDLAGGSASILAGGSDTMVLSSLSITGSGQLDINDNPVILNYTDIGVLTAVSAYLAAGRGAGAGAPATWLGPGGIISNVAHSIGNGFNVAVGYANNADLAIVNASGSYTTFGGQTVGSQTILIKMTLGADANLDGVVDASDVSIIGTHFDTSTSGQWYYGDFDYSGTCDASDISVLGTTFGKPLPT